MGLGAVPHFVVGPANVSCVGLQGPNGQLALYGHFVEGLLTQDFKVGIIPNLQGLAFITPRKNRFWLGASGSPTSACLSHSGVPHLDAQSMEGSQAHGPVGVAPALHPCHIGLRVPRGIAEQDIRAIHRHPRNTDLWEI